MTTPALVSAAHCWRWPFEDAQLTTDETIACAEGCCWAKLGAQQTIAHNIIGIPEKSHVSPPYLLGQTVAERLGDAHDVSLGCSRLTHLAR